jgi:hypothetical protein
MKKDPSAVIMAALAKSELGICCAEKSPLEEVGNIVIVLRSMIYSKESL